MKTQEPIFLFDVQTAKIARNGVGTLPAKAHAKCRLGELGTLVSIVSIVSKKLGNTSKPPRATTDPSLEKVCTILSGENHRAREDTSGRGIGFLKSFFQLLAWVGGV